MIANPKPLVLFLAIIYFQVSFKFSSIFNYIIDLLKLLFYVELKSVLI